MADDNQSKEQDRKLPDNIADAWAAVLIDIHEKRRKRDVKQEGAEGVPRQIFGVGDLNIPGPTTNAIAAHVKATTAGGKAITTEQIAKSLNCSVGKAEYGLNMAKRMGLVRQLAKGWVAT